MDDEVHILASAFLRKTVMTRASVTWSTANTSTAAGQPLGIDVVPSIACHHGPTIPFSYPPLGAIPLYIRSREISVRVIEARRWKTSSLVGKRSKDCQGFPRVLLRPCVRDDTGAALGRQDTGRINVGE